MDCKSRVLSQYNPLQDQTSTSLSTVTRPVLPAWEPRVRAEPGGGFMNPATPRAALMTALAHLGPHDHLCSIYESEEEQFHIAMPFIRIGLERGEQCLYIAAHDRVGAVREAMRREGIDVDRATHSQALTVLTPEQTYLTDGSFHLEAMVTVWEDAIERARREGFTALRTTGETEWVLRGAPGLER